MKTLTKEILGFEVPIVNVAETLEEMTQLSGSPERVVASANNYVLYHQHYGKLRTKIVNTLVEKTGEKLEENEKDLAYIGRLEEKIGGEALKALLPDVVAACQAIPVDYTAPVRGTGEGSTVAQKWLAAFDDLDQKGKVGAFITKYGVDVDGLTDDEKKLVVARKIKEVITKAQEAAMASVSDV